MEENIKNIFEGAKFGDKFLTRNGRVAIYARKSDHDDKLVNWCLIENTSYTWAYNDNGIAQEIDHQFDIVSKYQESIDEEKPDELAEQLCSENNSYREGYKAAVNNAKDWIKSHTQSVAYLSTPVSSITIPLYGNEYAELFEQENMTMNNYDSKFN